MTAPRYISTPFCIWVSKPGVADGGGSGREVGLLCCYGRWYYNRIVVLNMGPL